MQVTITQDTVAGGSRVKAGTVLDLPDNEARLLVNIGKAEAGASQVEEEPKASQAVQDFAADNDVDLSQVEGSGKDGNILKKDVQAVIDSRE